MLIAAPASVREALRACRALKNSLLIWRLPMSVNIRNCNQQRTGLCWLAEISPAGT